MLLAAWNSDEAAGPHALLACVVLIYISAFDKDKPNIIGVRVKTRVESRLKPGKRAVGFRVRIPLEDRLGSARSQFFILRLLSGDENYFILPKLVFMSLHNTHRPHGR